jgi:hypothetical protein
LTARTAANFHGPSSSAMTNVRVGGGANANANANE